ncbi:SEL1-like repeat protein [Helicobacter vulpis]|uniref:hypothetical protein n=1 Tax=Helicobacter vulpis TaxID=2316076 RepID=UPI001F274D61|nr:hypothetical protein [Helicobacter vulpis]
MWGGLYFFKGGQKKGEQKIEADSSLSVYDTSAYTSAYYNKAKEAYKDKDYAHALRYFQKAAQTGDGAAYYNLGRMYQNGLGVPQDYEKSIQYFQAYARALMRLKRACIMRGEQHCAAVERMAKRAESDFD